MRVLRFFLASAVLLALLAGQSGVGVAQSDAQAIEPPAEFKGRLACPDPLLTRDGAVENVALGPVGDGNLVRRERRGDSSQMVVEEMSDPRFAGTWSAYLNTDEYIYPGVDMNDLPAVQTGTVRIENEAGAWQGSAHDGYLPGTPTTTWGLMELAGEGAYDGLTAIQWTNLVDPTCACWETDNLCEWDVRGFVIEGAPPPAPMPPTD